MKTKMFMLLMLSYKQISCKRKGERNYLVGMVSTDVAQCGGSGLAERTVDYSGRFGLCHVTAKWKDRRGANGGG